MCRGFIQSYFLLRKEPDLMKKQQQEKEKEQWDLFERTARRWIEEEERQEEERRAERQEERRAERQEDNDDEFWNPLTDLWLRIPDTAGGWVDVLHSFWMFLFTTRDFQ